MPDFPNGEIKIRYNSDNWGPFTFDFSDAIFTSDTITSVTVRAFQGNVKPSDDLDDETEVTALIDSDVPATTASNVVSVWLKFPGAAYTGEKFTLIFEVTLTSNTGIHPFYFQYVRVE